MARVLSRDPVDIEVPKRPAGTCGWRGGGSARRRRPAKFWLRRPGAPLRRAPRAAPAPGSLGPCPGAVSVSSPSPGAAWGCERLPGVAPERGVWGRCLPSSSPPPGLPSPPHPSSPAWPSPLSPGRGQPQPRRPGRVPAGRSSSGDAEEASGGSSGAQGAASASPPAAPSLPAPPALGLWSTLSGDRCHLRCAAATARLRVQVALGSPGGPSGGAPSHLEVSFQPDTTFSRGVPRRGK